MMVFSGLMLVITALASPLGKNMGDPIDIPIHPVDEQGDIGRPRGSSLFTVSLDIDLNILSVSTNCYVGYVDVVIENLTTYEYSEDSFDSTLTAFLPISGNTGIWRITFILGSGDEYYGIFEL